MSSFQRPPGRPGTQSSPRPTSQKPRRPTTRVQDAEPVDLDQLEESLKELRIAYEKYFAGVERLEPQKERDRIKAILRRLRSTPTSNTAKRFRVQQLQASLVTHEAYWNRICRQIEEGTFKRDRLRAARLQQRAPAAGTRSAGAASPAYPEALVRLHADYEQTRKALGHATPLSIETLARTVDKQTAAIKERYRCEGVDFRVEAKDGKPILKAIPRTAGTKKG